MMMPNAEASSRSESPAEDPYALGLHSSEQGHFDRSRSLVALGAAGIAGVFAAALGGILCWAVVKVLLPGPGSTNAPVAGVPLPILLPVLAAGASGLLIGLRVNRRLTEQFRRVSQLEEKRAMMAEQAADFRMRLRQTSASRRAAKTDS